MAKKRPTWALYDQLLGVHSDRAIAKLVGVSRIAVLRRRQKLEISPFIPWYRRGKDAGIDTTKGLA